MNGSKVICKTSSTPSSHERRSSGRRTPTRSRRNSRETSRRRLNATPASRLRSTSRHRLASCGPRTVSTNGRGCAEVACDLIATELTLEHFAESDPSIGPQTVLPAILMALHHLTSLEFLATVVDPRALELEATLQATMVRKSVWRDMTRKMYEAERGELGRMYVSATQHHAKYLGDQVLFIVPGHWREAQESLAGRARDNAPDVALLRDAVWSFAKPG